MCSFHRRPIDLYTFCCHFMISSCNTEECICEALQHSWCLTAAVQVALSSPLCPLSVESVLAMPELVDAVQSCI